MKDLEEGQKGLKSEIRTIQKRLFNPDDGLIVEVHKNTEFKEENQENLKDVDKLISWKSNVTKTLWVIYSAIIGVILKFLLESVLEDPDLNTRPALLRLAHGFYEERLKDL